MDECPRALGEIRSADINGLGVYSEFTSVGQTSRFACGNLCQGKAGKELHTKHPAGAGSFAPGIVKFLESLRLGEKNIPPGWAKSLVYRIFSLEGSLGFPRQFRAFQALTVRPLGCLISWFNRKPGLH